MHLHVVAVLALCKLAELAQIARECLHALLHKCSICWQTKHAGEFSKRQLSKNEDRKCRRCTERVKEQCPVCMEQHHIGQDGTVHSLFCPNGHGTCLNCVKELVEPCPGGSTKCIAPCVGASYSCPLCRAVCVLDIVRLMCITKGSIAAASAAGFKLPGAPDEDYEESDDSDTEVIDSILDEMYAI